MSDLRLVLFVDAQNFYNDARRSFFTHSHPFIYGNFDPIKLGQLMCSRPPPSSSYVLHQVRVYTGRPDRRKEAKGYAANLRQCSTWQNAGAEVIARVLRYPPNWPAEKPIQKGVDVALAIDFIAMAMDNLYDVGVIASTDTDLLPALEFVCKRFPSKRVEVASWTGNAPPKRLSHPEINIWCHWLKKADYDHVADLTDYTSAPSLA